ncbi:MAG: hypothetical protein M3R63_22980, partial [Actinomycetota bacterium]|nr:hypothetical protein [Actinomycetota bacterium]
MTMSPDPRHAGADHAQIVASAKEDHESVLELTRALARIPSRAGIDPYDPIIDLLSRWMREHDLPADVVRDGTGAAVGLTAEVHGARPGPRWVLDPAWTPRPSVTRTPGPIRLPPGSPTTAGSGDAAARIPRWPLRRRRRAERRGRGDDRLPRDGHTRHRR